ncbi:MAG: hypothetical protein IJT98_07290 [Prevotella sp.]|nr:hypothetical protein [Prevotella sp.]
MKTTTTLKALVVSAILTLTGQPYSGDIVIPSKIVMEHDGNIVEHQVVAIDEGAFSSCTGLTSITIPATIKTIYADA